MEFEMSEIQTPWRYRNNYNEFVSIDMVFCNDYHADRIELGLAH